MSKACILLVFGIPATGKSSLVKELVSRTDQCSTWRNTQCIHVCFDDFYPPDVRDSVLKSEAESVPDLPVFKWKQQRARITSSIETCLNVNKLNAGSNTEDIVSLSNSSSSGSDSKDWDEFKHNLCTRNNTPDNIKILPNGKFTGDRNVVIVDDNLPLRSMRYEYYQIARKHQCGFCEVLVTCELSTALSWNNERAIPIPADTIVTMATSLELPDPNKHHWEGKSIVMKSDRWWNIPYQWNSICCEIYQLCEQAMVDPVRPAPCIVDPLVQEESRTITSSNLVHRVDQRLRECVSTVITHYKDNISSDNVAGHARYANGLRKSILDTFRSAPDQFSDNDNGRNDVTTLLKTIEQRFFTLYSDQTTH